MNNELEKRKNIYQTSLNNGPLYLPDNNVSSFAELRMNKLALECQVCITRIGNVLHKQVNIHHTNLEIVRQLNPLSAVILSSRARFELQSIRNQNSNLYHNFSINHILINAMISMYFACEYLKCPVAMCHSGSSRKEGRGVEK